MRECWICRTGGGEDLKKFCSCRGDLEFAHKACLMSWLKASGRGVCTICGGRYGLVTRASFLRGIIYRPVLFFVLCAMIVISLVCLYLLWKDFRDVWDRRNDLTPSKVRDLAATLAFEATLLLQGIKCLRHFVVVCFRSLFLEVVDVVELRETLD